MFKISEGQEKFEREFGTIDFFFSKLFFSQIFYIFFEFSNFERGSRRIERECGRIEFSVRKPTFFSISVFFFEFSDFGRGSLKLGESVVELNFVLKNNLSLRFLYFSVFSNFERGFYKFQREV